jgi:hypothetical protein
MSEAYASGAWVAREGHDEAFVEAWTEFAPSELELVAEV